MKIEFKEEMKKVLLERNAMKVARSVPRGGKSERIYLSRVNFKSVKNLADLNNIPKPAERPWGIARAGYKLSNPGDTLELQVPNHI